VYYTKYDDGKCYYILNVIMLCVAMMCVVMLNIVMLNVIMLSVIKLNIVMLNVIMLSVVMLNVVSCCQINTGSILYNFCCHVLFVGGNNKLECLSLPL
jgi:hypothetical protein